MKAFFLFCCAMLYTVAAGAQSLYTAAAINKKLLAHASAVVRNYEVREEVPNESSSTYTEKMVITVLNRSGEKYSNIRVWYNKLRAVKYIKGALYNEYGMLVKKFSERDFSDNYAGGDVSLFEDARVKHLNIGMFEYPYTIEYEYQVKNKQTLSFGPGCQHLTME